MQHRGIWRKEDERVSGGAVERERRGGTKGRWEVGKTRWGERREQRNSPEDTLKQHEVK